jgi:maltoporin
LEHLDIENLDALMPSMRTTLTLDPDVAARLAAEAARSDRAFKAVVNEALRRGLGLSSQVERRQTYKVTPVKLRFRPGHDTDKLNELADELETEAVVRGMRR